MNPNSALLSGGQGWGNLSYGKGKKKKKKQTGVEPRSFIIRKVNDRIN